MPDWESNRRLHRVEQSVAPWTAEWFAQQTLHGLAIAFVNSDPSSMASCGSHHRVQGASSRGSQTARNTVWKSPKSVWKAPKTPPFNTPWQNSAAREAGRDVPRKRGLADVCTCRGWAGFALAAGLLSCRVYGKYESSRNSVVLRVTFRPAVPQPLPHL